MVEFVAGVTRVKIGDAEITALIPLRRFAKMVDEQFELGQRVLVETRHQQSVAKRVFFEQTLADAYANLPDDIATRWISAEHFRKFLLIRCGYATEQQRVCNTTKEAEAAALWARELAPYSIVERSDKGKGLVVTIWTARSTSPHAMGGKEFAECVEKCTAFAADMIGVKPKELTAQHAKDKLAASLAPEQNSPADPPIAGEPEAALGSAVVSGNSPSVAPVADVQATAAGSWSSKTQPAAKRLLTFEEAERLLPETEPIKSAFLMDGRPTFSNWSREEVLYDLRSARTIAISDKVPQCPLGMRDRNARVVYFQTKDAPL